LSYKEADIVYSVRWICSKATIKPRVIEVKVGFQLENMKLISYGLSVV